MAVTRCRRKRLVTDVSASRAVGAHAVLALEAQSRGGDRRPRAPGPGGEPRHKPIDDVSLPGAESQQAIDLFQAHSPAFGGADSTLVFTVDDGKLTDPEPKAAIESALAKVRGLDGVELAASPFEPGGQVSQDGRLASVDVRYSTAPGEVDKADGEALIAAGETAEPGVRVEARGALIDLATERRCPSAS